MFDSCISFNQPIVLPDKIEISEAMFKSCNSFNQPITVSIKKLYLFCNSILIQNNNFGNKIIEADKIKNINFDKKINIRLKDLVETMIVNLSDEEYAEFSLLYMLENN